MRGATARVLLGDPRPAADNCTRPWLESELFLGWLGWMMGGWRSPEGPHGQQPRAYSDRPSERTREKVGAHVVLDAKRDGIWVRDGLALYKSAAGGLLHVRGVRPRAAATPAALPLGIGETPEAVDGTAQKCVDLFIYMQHATFSWANSPNEVIK